MKKDSEKELWKRLIQKEELQAYEIQKTREEFYPEGQLAEFSYSSDKDVVDALVVKSQMPDISPQPVLKDEQLENNALIIHENVRRGKPNNIEIRFDQMVQLFENKKYSLGNTAFKIRVRDGDTSPSFVFVKEESMLDLRVFIDGDNAMAILASRNEKGEINYAKLSEFHMLSLQENADPNKEIGLMTSYVWLTKKIYSSVILAWNLYPVKSLLLSEWLQAEWQRAKEATAQLSNGETGGQING